MPKFNYLGERFNEKNFRSEFVLACLQTRNVKDVNWPREMKIMNKLVKAYSPDYRFWDHARPEFQLPSLAWFLTPNGKKYLSNKKSVFNLDMVVDRGGEFKLENEKQEEDYKVEKKILSIKDFLSKKK
jgi:hypothetical protein